MTSTMGRKTSALFLLAALAGCGRTVELAPCNIAERVCQEDVYYAVMRLRGDGWDPFDGLPPIRTITLDQYRNELLGNRRPAPDPGDTPREPSKPKVNPWDVALQWLGLVTRETSSMQASVDDRVNNVAAYYSSRDSQVTVIDRGRERNDYYDTILLAHELVHAFQDNELRFSAHDGTTDGSFAGRARIEGEAVVYENLARAEIDRVDPLQVDWEGRYANSINYLRERLPAERSPFYAASWFVYPLGADWLMRGWLEGGNAAVRTLTANPPRGAGDLMARHEGKEHSRAADLACAVDKPDDDFELVGRDRFGAMQLYGFLARSGMSEADAWRTALAWGDDRLWLYFDEDRGLTGLTWRLRLANTAAAEAVLDAAAQRPELRAERRGRDVLIVASDDAIADWPGADGCGD
jgi:hypothetical protein